MPDASTPLSAAPATASADPFAAMFALARPKMFLVALAIVADRTEAEDVLQDATITGLSKFRAGEFREGSNFDAWMAQITRFTALNARRARHAAPSSLGDATERLGGAAPSSGRSGGRVPPVDVDGDDAVALRRALDGLSETARLCLLLRIVGGLAYSAIATITQLPEGTAMSHVHRAQRAVRQELTALADGAHDPSSRQGSRA
ncbi:MAG: RNA polymerase sigma factor [Phycisphaerales bacterium]|nr:RNA polymerase sigma factor [Phycisphaerales bacterium]